eukprot:TRINITY_DN1841_c1_g1_i2.p8 TRINITY_DN1841_c1_g1~~TRINITY_DN1841_c1_g1_i2.p8  ORF type:complete len:102 (-),score=18.52 TRINITY_DN1841_c1_g1_i2:716-1021(-)
MPGRKKEHTPDFVAAVKTGAVIGAAVGAALTAVAISSEMTQPVQTDFDGVKQQQQQQQSAPRATPSAQKRDERDSEQNTFKDVIVPLVEFANDLFKLYQRQ